MTAGGAADGGPVLLPGLWKDYYAPELAVRVNGRALDPTTKGDVLQISVTLDQEQPAMCNLVVSDWDDVKLAFKYSSTMTSCPSVEKKS